MEEPPTELKLNSEEVKVDHRVDGDKGAEEPLSIDIDMKALCIYIQKSSTESNQAQLIQLTRSDKRILSRIHIDLLSENVSKRKLSLHLLRLLTTPETEDPSSPITLFFDTFEILDEKQSHIIEPFLINFERRSQEFQTDEFLLRAHLTILQKMIHHDNRKIVEMGLNAFMSARSTIRQLGEREDNLTTRSMFLNFLELTIMPKIRDSVAWIFPGAQQFFMAAKTFGKFLINMEEDIQPGSIFQFLFKFLIDSQGKGLSPLAAIFILKALSSSLSELSSVHSLGNVDLNLLNTFLGNISTIASSYIRSVIETEIISIFSQLYPTPADNSGNSDHNQEVDTLKCSSVRQFFLQLSRNGICSNWRHFRTLNFSTILETPSASAPGDEMRATGRLIFIILFQKLQIVEESDKDSFTDGVVASHLDLLDGNPGMLEFLQCLGLCATRGMGTDLRNGIFNDVFTKGITRISESPTQLDPAAHTYHLLEIILESKFDFHSSLEETYKILEQEISNISDLGRSMGTDLRKISRLLILSKVLVTFALQSSPVCNHEVFQKVLDSTQLENYEGERDLHLVSKFYESRINMLSHILQVLSVTPGNTQVKINAQALSMVRSMDILPPTGIVASINFIISCLSFPQLCPRMHEMMEFVSYCWSQVLEMKRSDLFWKGVSSFVGLITHEYFQGCQILAEYAMKIFEKGETIIGIPLILLEKLSTLSYEGKDGTRLEEIKNVCIRATYFGVHLMKHMRLVSRIYDYECKQETMEISWRRDCLLGIKSWEKPEFILTADCNVRILGLVTLLDLQMLNECNSASLSSVVEHLLEINDKGSERNCRYFGNSPIHRIKQRIAQTLLLLQPHFTSGIAKLVTSRLMTTLCRDSSQQSVRYLMEWIIALNLIKFQELRIEFLEASVKHMGQRAGFGCSFSTLALQVVQGIISGEMYSADKVFITRVMDMLVNLLIGQHLPVRVYASLSFLRIYDKWISNLSVDSLERYEVIYKNLIQGSLATSGTFLKTTSAVVDFWVDYFHPVTDFNLEAVLIDVPLLSGMSFDESIQRKDLLSLIGSCPKFQKIQISLYHSETRRKEYILRSGESSRKFLSEETSREMGEESAEGILSNDAVLPPKLFRSQTSLQKKVNPWKFLPVAEEELTQFSEIIQERKKSCTNEGLVVVASLVDLIPNLGGLCRSSEIFGVSKLVISSLKILNDQQFKTLSVSSHNWVEIMEVLPRELEVFLSSYAAKGYTILAIEQAVGSIPLNQYSFPRKSVLLLGHEKRGIPAELLHVVDKCLEIPQLGVVRSLNVHVTGAIAIWQYASQHLIP